MDSVTWYRTRPPLPPLPKGGSRRPLRGRHARELARVFAYVLALFFSAPVWAPQTAVADQSLLRQFQEQYRPAAQRLSAALDNVRLVVDLRGNTDKCAIEKELLIKGSSKLEIRKYSCPPDKRRPFAEVICSSPALSFNLIRINKDDPYSVKWTSSRLSQKERKLLSETTIDLFTNAAFSIVGDPLPDMLDEPGFDLTRFDMDDGQRDGSDPSATIEFTLASENHPTKSARVHFSPTRSWVITAYDNVRMKSHDQTISTYSGRQSYPDSIAFEAIPETIDLTAFNASVAESPVEVTRAQISQVTQGAVDDSQFTLAAFGLENVGPGASLPPSRRGLVILTVNLVFFAAVSAGVYVRRRRRKVVICRTQQTEISSERDL